MTRSRMENIASFYVQRYASSAENLRRVLLRRADKARRIHGGDRNEEKQWIEDIVARMQRTGVLDDERYALGRAVALRRLGRSPAKIRAHLAQKGIGNALIDAALAETSLTDDGTDAALEAAISYARRRRLGPFGEQPRSTEDRKILHKKHMAALARAGFTYDVARRVMEMTEE